MESNNDTPVPGQPGNHIMPTWLAAAASVPGRSHLRTGIPCQDATAAGVSPRPWLIVCDGRGSASHSDIGANAAVEAIRSQLDNAAEVFTKVLDADDEEEARHWHPLLVRLIYRTAAQEQRRQASRLGASPESFEHTLLVVVCGRKRFMYIQVGDGGIVMRSHGGSLQVLSEPARGEFANTTFFVTSGRQTTWRHRLMSMEDACGFMAFSDGPAEKLVVAADNKASPAVGQILERATAGNFGHSEILRFLTETHWEPQVQDDRALALLVSTGVQSDIPLAGSEPESEFSGAPVAATGEATFTSPPSRPEASQGPAAAASTVAGIVAGGWHRHRAAIVAVAVVLAIGLMFASLAVYMAPVNHPHPAAAARTAIHPQPQRATQAKPVSRRQEVPPPAKQPSVAPAAAVPPAIKLEPAGSSSPPEPVKPSPATATPGPPVHGAATRTGP
jgi:hypothetical protein